VPLSAKKPTSAHRRKAGRFSPNRLEPRCPLALKGVASRSTTDDREPLLRRDLFEKGSTHVLRRPDEMLARIFEARPLQPNEHRHTPLDCGRRLRFDPDAGIHVNRPDVDLIFEWSAFASSPTGSWARRQVVHSDPRQQQAWSTPARLSVGDALDVTSSACS
jgi:hypothetical protein